MRPFPLVLLALVGCSNLPEEVLLTGTVLDGPDGAPLADAELAVFDEQGGSHGTTTSDGGGNFELLAPVGDVVFVDVAKAGYATASHTGVAGVQETQMVEPGTIYGFPEAELEQWRADFAGCPGLDEEGGAVVGEVRIFDIVEVDTNEHPTAGTAVVTVDDGRGTTWEACYLDDEGLGFDPEGQWTGETGRFAIFGIPEGEYRLTVAYEISEGSWGRNEYPVRVPAAGVAPRFPVWVELGF